ncbi:SDR family oxidoreductase [Nocardia halotolerans]|uniref:SDR family oxidoreductase n=1 Tax=Nocardia halotolerans TaxID=1755878 RepID=A0ABV8VJA8_9NOCA
MRIAVVGASGRIGQLTGNALKQNGHDVVPISRGHGVDVYTGVGLAAALADVHAVVDVTNCTATGESENVDFFTTATKNLLEQGRRAGVRHHVTLSIAGVGRVAGNAHYAGKRAQEAAVEAGETAYTIVPATQFHDFAAMVASWTEQEGVARIAPLLIQPIAPAEVAGILARVAAGEPQGRHVDIAGPGPQDLVDMARRTYAARGRSVQLVPTWDNGLFDATMAGEVLLPGADAEIAPTSFEDWLADEYYAAP